MKISEVLTEGILDSIINKLRGWASTLSNAINRITAKLGLGKTYSFRLSELTRGLTESENNIGNAAEFVCAYKLAEMLTNAGFMAKSKTQLASLKAVANQKVNDGVYLKNTSQSVRAERLGESLAIQIFDDIFKNATDLAHMTFNVTAEGADNDKPDVVITLHKDDAEEVFKKIALSLKVTHNSNSTSFNNSKFADQLLSFFTGQKPTKSNENFEGHLASMKTAIERIADPSIYKKYSTVARQAEELRKADNISSDPVLKKKYKETYGTAFTYGEPLALPKNHEDFVYEYRDLFLDVLNTGYSKLNDSAKVTFKNNVLSLFGWGSVDDVYYAILRGKSGGEDIVVGSKSTPISEPLRQTYEAFMSERCDIEFRTAGSGNSRIIAVLKYVDDQGNQQLINNVNLSIRIGHGVPRATGQWGGTMTKELPTINAQQQAATAALNQAITNPQTMAKYRQLPELDKRTVLSTIVAGISPEDAIDRVLLSKQS